MSSSLTIGEIVWLKADAQTGKMCSLYASRFNPVLSNSNNCFTSCAPILIGPFGARNIQQHPYRLKKQLQV